MRSNGRTHRGFSLVELVVVVMILGILGAIAAPRLLRTSDQAVDGGLCQTLSVIRDSIDRFAAEHEGTLPGADGLEQTLKDDLARYLRGPTFPICPVGEANNDLVRMVEDESTVISGMAASSETHSWVYCYTSGEFGVNCEDTSADGVRTYDEF